MQKITIDEELKALLPALDKETYGLLEENLLKNGCRDSLVLWDGVLIDGHNRYEICTKHGIPFETVNMEFASREDALIWIISTQVSRRNLSPMQLSHYRGLHYRADKKIQGTNNQYAGESEKYQNDVFHSSTAVRLAEKYNVSSATINRDAKIAEGIDAIGEASAEAKKKILSGEVSINKKDLGELASLPKKDIARVAASIEAGTYEKPKAVAPAQKEGGGHDGAISPAGAYHPAGPAVGGSLTPYASIGKITAAFNAESGKLAEKGDIAGLKKVLRTYIEALEGIYKHL